MAGTGELMSPVYWLALCPYSKPMKIFSWIWSGVLILLHVLLLLWLICFWRLEFERIELIGTWMWNEQGAGGSGADPWIWAIFNKDWWKNSDRPICLRIHIARPLHPTMAYSSRSPKFPTLLPHWMCPGSIWNKWNLLILPDGVGPCAL